MTGIVVGSWYGDISNPEHSICVNSVENEVVEVSVWLLSIEDQRLLSTVDLSLAEVDGYIESGQWLLAATPAE